LIEHIEIRRERSTQADAHLRARLGFVNGAILEFSEYVQRIQGDEIAAITYSYHWADAQGRLIRRWDNTPHFPGLPSFPHHIHEGPEDVVAPGQPMDIFAVLDSISATAS
jgi:hypothetical protein